MNRIKIGFISVLSVIGSVLGVLAIPVFVLIVANITDYITGLMASGYRTEKISSYKSFRGIFKKVCMWLLIIIGAMVDWLLISTGQSVGMVLPFNFAVAIIVTVWLIANEIISILENMLDIGVELPPFLLPLVKNIKKQVEKKTEVKEE